jgi:signal transduction histidine kinase
MTPRPSAYPKTGDARAMTAAIPPAAPGPAGAPDGLGGLPADFLSQLTHELKSHLAAAQTACFLLRRHRGAEASEKERKWLEALDGSVAGVRAVMLQLDALERARREPLAAEAGTEEIGPWLETLVERVRSAAPAPVVGVQRQVEVSGSWHLREPLLGLALECLVQNAVKFSPPDTEARVAVRRSDGELQFIVSDHGTGVKAEEEARLFTPFFQGSNARGRSGCGLGLAIAQSAVSRLGGAITYAHFPGCGTEFRLRVPAVAAT